MDAKQINVLFLTHRDIKQASSRFRAYQYAELLESRGFNCHVSPLPEKGVLRRLFYLTAVLFRVPANDIVVIQKILFARPILYVLRLLNNNIIFDWDDALYAAPPSNVLLGIDLKKRVKRLNYTLRTSKSIMCGNRTLWEYSLKYNNNAHVIPTAIDTDMLTVGKKRKSDSCIIGWIGKSENLEYLLELEDVFRALYERYGSSVCLRVVSNKSFYSHSGMDIINKKWRLAEEISDIQSFDIGIMPLDDNEWSRGKCAFKALQYMAAGVPCVASPVGANNEVVKNGYNGYLADSPQEWIECLSSLIDDADIRASLGEHGRKHVLKEYSIRSNIDKLTRLFYDSLGIGK
ncbi:MAG: glycosyltransferase family 4 protein [Nitrospirota bacterium]|jgi:glycosyltransferase involved in cell wall biosynthesis